MTTIRAIENDITSRQEIHSENCNTIWICYRCNLTFHKESIVLFVVSVMPFQAFGDGFTQENVYASVGNRKMAMFVKINPPILTSQNLQDRYLLLRFFDAETNNPIKNVSFFLNVTKGNQLLM